jgi:hypothetical protein
MTRPAIANERLTCNRAGQVVLQLKSPTATAPPTSSCRRWSSCNVWPMPAPRPRLHLIRFHRVPGAVCIVLTIVLVVLTKGDSRARYLLIAAVVGLVPGHRICAV